MTDKPPSADTPEPDWSLLPRDPVKFFSLQNEWTENDLKSAYSKLIRKFKPDRAPEEFKKIRRAYEILKARLDYGSGGYSFPIPKPEESESNTSGSNGSSGSWPDERWGIIPPTEPVTYGINPSSPEESFRSLLAKGHKTSEDYIDLAILADIVNEEEFPERRTFESWLWEGLLAYPRSRSLMETLASYYNDTTNHDEIDFTAAIRHVVAFRPRTVSDELLSGLIFGLVKANGIKRCLQLWDDEFQAHASGNVVILKVLIDLMPSAAWFHEDDWVEKQKKFLESDNNWQRIDFESLERALKVVTLARVQPEKTDGRTQLVHKIHEICEKVLKLSPQSRREVLLKSAEEICKRQNDILAAKVVQRKADHALVELWEFLLTNSNVIRPIHGINQGQILSLRRFLADVCKDVPTWLWHCANHFAVGLVIAVGILALSASLFIILKYPHSNEDFAMYSGLGILAILVVAVVTLAMYADRIQSAFSKTFWPIVERPYRPQRGRLLEFFDAQPMPVRAYSLLLGMENKANHYPGLKHSVCRTILSDSDLLLLAVTSRAF